MKSDISASVVSSVTIISPAGAPERWSCPCSRCGRRVSGPRFGRQQARRQRIGVLSSASKNLPDASSGWNV
jgi:hypothetical protein